MEATHGAYDVHGALGSISYADGIRLMNQFYLDQSRENILVAAQRSVAIDLEKLFG